MIVRRGEESTYDDFDIIVEERGGPVDLQGPRAPRNQVRAPRSAAAYLLPGASGGRGSGKGPSPLDPPRLHPQYRPTAAVNPPVDAPSIHPERDDAG
mmetsp:Transcript_24572/g.71893  ORF Transcript_24572/g.71893 Transcript_24572/m.71893 type:complete len:97 (+) Transcript_24572:325-615(+)